MLTELKKRKCQFLVDQLRKIFRPPQYRFYMKYFNFNSELALRIDNLATSRRFGALLITSGFSPNVGVLNYTQGHLGNALILLVKTFEKNLGEENAL